MNRTVISLGALWTILALASTGLSQTATQEEKAKRPGQRPIPASATTADATGEQKTAEPRQQYQRLQQQIDELKESHKSLLVELQAIQKTAAKEKATETAAQIKTLIDTRQQAFQKALVNLEQQQAELRRGGRVRPERSGDAGTIRRKRAPQFELTSVDGRAVKLSNYKGRIVVLEWINPDCPYSQYHHETAHTIADLATKYKDKRVVWFAVNSTNSTTVEACRAFAQKCKLPYPILDDRTGEVGRQYGARKTPYVVVIDAKGTIAYEGAIDSAPQGKHEPGIVTVNYLDKALSELLAGQKVSMPNTPAYGSPVNYNKQ